MKKSKYLFEDDLFKIVKEKGGRVKVYSADTNQLLSVSYSTTAAIEFVFSHYKAKHVALDKLPDGGDYSPPERIVCAANKYGEVVIAGVRHACDVMCNSLETAITYHAVKNQIDFWYKESHHPDYSEGHASTYAVYRLRPIIEKHGKHLPPFKRNEEIQGFLTSKHRFVDRYEAWKIAVSQNQIVRRCGGDDSKGGKLYSENLY